MNYPTRTRTIAIVRVRLRKGFERAIPEAGRGEAALVYGELAGSSLSVAAPPSTGADTVQRTGSELVSPMKLRSGQPEAHAALAPRSSSDAGQVLPRGDCPLVTNSRLPQRRTCFLRPMPLPVLRGGEVLLWTDDAGLPGTLLVGLVGTGFDGGTTREGVEGREATMAGLGGDEVEGDDGGTCPGSPRAVVALDPVADGAMTAPGPSAPAAVVVTTALDRGGTKIETLDDDEVLILLPSTAPGGAYPAAIEGAALGLENPIPSPIATPRTTRTHTNLSAQNLPRLLTPPLSSFLHRSPPPFARGGGESDDPFQSSHFSSLVKLFARLC